MTERLDTNIAQLNKILDNVTEALVDISNKREEQSQSISNLAQMIESKNGIMNEKFNKLEKLVRASEININTDINKIRIENRTVDSGFTDRVNKLDIQIKQIEESLKVLQVQFEENNRILKGLIPVAGQKRKRCWLGF